MKSLTKKLPILIVMCKNEAHVIERLFDSVKEYVAGILVVDTGSTDTTVETVFAWGERTGVYVECVKIQWVNFAHCRNECLRIASGLYGADRWYLLADADWELIRRGEEKRLELPSSPYIKAVAFKVAGLGVGLSHSCLIRDLTHWTYKGAIHEYLEYDAGDENEIRFNREYWGDWIFHCHKDGATRDLRGDLKALSYEVYDKEVPESRDVFYLGNTAFDLGDYELAEYWYKKRIVLGGWIDEVWYSKLRIARIHHINVNESTRRLASLPHVQMEMSLWEVEMFKKAKLTVLGEYAELMEIAPHRPEPYMHMSELLRDLKLFRVSLELVQSYEHISADNFNLFTTEWMYEFGLTCEYAISYQNIYGDTPDSDRHFETAHAAIHATPHSQAKITYLNWIHERISPCSRDNMAP